MDITVCPNITTLFATLNGGLVETEVTEYPAYAVVWDDSHEDNLDLTITRSPDLVVLFGDQVGEMLDLYISRYPALTTLFAEPRTDRHKIGGTVKVDGVLSRRMVVAFDRRTMTYLGGTLSDPTTGEWELTGLQEIPERALLVVSMCDRETGEYNAEVADLVTQVATVEV